MERRKIIVAALIFLMIATSFAVLVTYNAVPQKAPVKAQSINPAVTFPTSNTATLDATVNYWHNVAISNSGGGSGTLSYSENSSQNYAGINGANSWTGSGSASSGYGNTQYTITINLGKYYYYQSSPLNLYGITFRAPEDAYDTGNGLGVYNNIGTVTASLSVGGNTQTWSHTFNSNAGSFSAVQTQAVEISPSWTMGSAYPLTFSLTLTVTPDVSSDGMYAPGAVYTYAGSSGTNSLSSSEPGYSSIPFAYGWHFNSQTTSYSPSSDVTSYSLSFSAVSSVDMQYNGGNHYGTSGTFSASPTVKSVTAAPNSDPPDVSASSSSFTYSYSVVSQEQAQQVTGVTGSSYDYSAGSSIVQTQNWFNATYAFSIGPPSGAISNPSLATTSGTIDASTTMTWTVGNILSAGYNTGSAVDVLTYSGEQSGTINNPAQYSQIKEGTAQTINSASTITYHANEFVNYPVHIASPLSVNFANSGSTASLSIGTSEVINGEKEQVSVLWNSAQTSPDTFTITPGSFTHSHTYSTIGTQDVSVTVTNIPNGDPVSASAQSVTKTYQYTISLSANPYPSPLTVLYAGDNIYLTFTQSNVLVNTVSATVNGYNNAVTENSATNYSLTSSSFGTSPAYVTWTLSGGSITHSYQYQYGAPLVPGQNSSHVSTVFGNSPTYTYPVSLSNTPQQGEIPITITNSQSTATGTYQQLINFPTSEYANSINSQFSDVYFTYGNGTVIPAWIQSNASNNYSSTPIWLKLNSIASGGSATVYAHVNPNSDYFTQAWADVGEAPQLSAVYGEYDNAYELGTSNSLGIAYYNNFTNASDASNNFVGYGYGIASINGIVLYESGTSIGAATIEGLNMNATSTANSLRPASQQTYTNATYFVYFSSVTGGVHLAWGSTLGTLVTTAGTYSDFGSGGFRYIWAGGAYAYSNVTEDYVLVAYMTNMPTASVSTSMIATNDTQQYYQQMINIPTPSQYGINAGMSNFLITSSSGSPYYAWVQNSTIVWVKIPYSTSATQTLNLQVYPSFENLISKSGYLEVSTQMSTSEGVNKTLGWITSTITISSGNYGFYNFNFNVSNSNFWLTATQSITVIGNTYQDGDIQLRYQNSSVFFFGEGNDNGQTTPLQWRWQGSSTPPSLTPSQSTNVPYHLTIHVDNGAYTYYVNGTELLSGNFTPEPYYTAFLSGDTSFTTDYYYSGSLPSLTFTMPTASISSSGIPFQTNGTTINHQHYALVSSYIYNQTLSAFTYNIYDSFNYPDMTLYYNSSWTFQYSSPTPYASGDMPGGGKFLTYTNIAGVGYITATFLQPSPSIGQPTIVTLEPEENNTSLFLSSVHTIATYFPYDSNTPQTATGFGAIVTVPFGSNATFTLYNQWDQAIGTIKNVLIDQSSPLLVMPVQVAQLNFNFENATETTVNLEANGLTFSYFGNALVAYNQTYLWTTSVFDLYEGKSVNYSGSVTVNKLDYNLNIFTNSPPVSLDIIINGYNESNQGELGLPGTPPVKLLIDGTPQTIGSTFVGFVGSTYNITVEDVLGQVLYQQSLTLTTTTYVDQIYIPVPSWQFTIQNQEQVPSNSPLATEQISLNLSGSHTYYNMTDQVGQQALLYLKQGSYFVHLQDNATFNATFDLTQNTNYVIFGQSLLTYQEFISIMNGVLNNTSGIELITDQADTLVIPQQQVSYELTPYFTNGTQLSQSQLENATIVVQIHNSTGTVNLATSTYSSNGNLYVNFTAPSNGQFTISIGVIYGSLAGRTSYELQVQAISKLSEGMELQATGPSVIGINQTFNYTITVDYANGTPMDLQDTAAVFNNTTIAIYNGLDPIQAVYLITYYPGIIVFNATFNQTGGFSLYVQSHADLNGYASGTTLIPVYVEPSSPQSIQATIVGSNTASPGVSNTYPIFFQYGNGTFLTSTQIAEIAASGNVSVYEGTSLVQVVTSLSPSGTAIYFTFKEYTAGNYSLVFHSTYNGLGINSLLFVKVTANVTLSEGMDLQLIGIQNALAGSSYNYTITVDYTNGTPMDLQDTLAVYNNLTVGLFNGVDPTLQYTMLSYAAGLIFFNATIEIPGIYTLYIQTSANLNGYTSGTAAMGVNVYTQSAESVNAVMVGPSQTAVKTSQTYTISLSYSNGTFLSQSATGSLLANSTVQIYEGSKLITSSATLQAGSSVLYFTYDFTSKGNYTLVYEGTMNGIQVHTLLNVEIYGTSVPSKGLSMKIIGIQNALARSSYNYTILADYANGTPMDLQDTLAVYNNLSIGIYNGVDPAVQYSLLSYDAGLIFLNITISLDGIYTVYAQSFANLNGYAAGTAATGVNVYSPAREGLEAIMTGVPQTLAGSLQTFTISLSYSNGTFLSSGIVSAILANSSVQIYEGTLLITSSSSLMAGSSAVFFNYTFSSVGNYTLVFQSSYNGSQVHALINVQAYKTVPASKGVDLKLIGTQDALEGQFYNYTLLVNYANGTPMDLQDTLAVYNNLSIGVYDGVDPAVQYNFLSYAPGLIFFNVSIPSPGIYTIYAMGFADLRGYASGTAASGVSVYSQSPESISAVMVGVSQTPLSTDQVYTVSLSYGNGNYLSQKITQAVLANASVGIYEGTNQVGSILSFKEATSIIYFNYTFSSVGNYTLVFESSYNGMQVKTLANVEVYKTVLPSKGISLNPSGANQGILNTTYNYTITVNYANGSAMDLQDTESVFNNMTITIYNGIDPPTAVHLVRYFPGIIIFNATFNTTGVYSMYIQSYSDLSGYAYGDAIVPISVSPNTPPTMSEQLSGSPSVTAGKPTAYLIQFFYGNATYFSQTDTLNALNSNNTTVTVFNNGVQVTRITNFTFLENGTAVFSLTLNSSEYEYYAYSQTSMKIDGKQVSARSILQISSGVASVQNSYITASLNNLKSIQVNTTNNFILTLTYTGNGSLLSSQDTYSILQNLTGRLLIVNGKSQTFISYLGLAYLSPGKIGFSLNESRLSQNYQILITSDKGTNLSGHIVSPSASQYLVVSTLSNVNPLGAVLALIQAGQAILQFLGSWGSYILIFSGLVGLIWEIVRRILRYRKRDRLKAEGWLTNTNQRIVEKYYMEGPNSLTEQERDIFAGLNPDAVKYYQEGFIHSVQNGVKALKQKSLKAKKTRGIL